MARYSLRPPTPVEERGRGSEDHERDDFTQTELVVQRPRPLQHRESSLKLNSAFLRDSVAKMFSTAPSLPDLARRHSPTLRRLQQKSNTASPSLPSTPMRDYTNRGPITPHSATTTASTSFLPELGSTPPMPTFQKPSLRMTHSSPATTTTSSSTRSKLASSGSKPSLTELPTPTKTTTPKPQYLIPLTNNREPPELNDLGNLLGHRAPSPHPPPPPNRVLQICASPLPATWTAQHDKAICVLDARDYPLPTIITRLRKAFPNLNGVQLTPAAIERRLRMLDQDVNVDYFRVGLARKKRSEGRRAKEVEVQSDNGDGNGNDGVACAELEGREVGVVKEDGQMF